MKLDHKYVVIYFCRESFSQTDSFLSSSTHKSFYDWRQFPYRQKHGFCCFIGSKVPSDHGKKQKLDILEQYSSFLSNHRSENAEEVPCQTSICREFSLHRSLGDGFSKEEKNLNYLTKLLHLSHQEVNFLKMFSEDTDRADWYFLIRIRDEVNSSCELMKFLRLSHGQAPVGRRFSVDKATMKERSFIARTISELFDEDAKRNAMLDIEK